jgi:hypothetical protein
LEEIRVRIKFWSLLLVIAVLASAFCVTAFADNDDLFYADLSSNPYMFDGNHIAYTVEQDCGKDFLLETVIRTDSIKDDNGRGIKFILRSHLLASSGFLELWIGRDHIWACANGWTGHTEFDFSPYMYRDVTIRILVKGSLMKLYLDGYEVWSCEDPTFNLGNATNIGISGWDCEYALKSVRVSPAAKNDAIPTPALKDNYTPDIPGVGGTTYYVDSNAAPEGNGLTPETAWKTIQQVNDHGQFLPGDKILFKRGCEWQGETLQPMGNGVAGNPIIVDSYGSGALPIIDRRGPWVKGGLNGTNAMLLKNQSYWTIRNIQLSNQNPVNPGKVEDVAILPDHAEFPMRNGLTVQVNYIPGYKANTVKGIVLENVVFCNIDGTMGDEGNCYYYRVSNGKKAGWAGGGALAVRAKDLDSGASRGYVDGLTVTNCTFRKVTPDKMSYYFEPLLKYTNPLIVKYADNIVFHNTTQSADE